MLMGAVLSSGTGGMWCVVSETGTIGGGTYPRGSPETIGIVSGGGPPKRTLGSISWGGTAAAAAAPLSASSKTSEGALALVAALWSCGALSLSSAAGYLD